MTIKFIHTSKKVSLEDSMRAATNLYNNSPKFRKMIDEMDETGVPVKIYIGDDLVDGFGRSGSTSIPHFQSYPDSDKEERLQQHKDGTPDENGITPSFDGRKVDRASVVIDTKQFTSNYRYPIAKDGSQKVTDDDHDGFADHTESLSYEAILAHELYHLKDSMDGRGQGDVWNETEEESFERKRIREIRAVKFEQEVMAEILPEGDPRAESRVYFPGNVSSETNYGREGRPHRSEFPAGGEVPHIINAAKPESTNRPPWKWYTRGPKVDAAHDSKKEPEDKTSQFIDREELRENNVSDSRFGASLAQNQTLNEVPAAVEPDMQSPSQADFTV